VTRPTVFKRIRIIVAMLLLLMWLLKNMTNNMKDLGLLLIHEYDDRASFISCSCGCYETFLSWLVAPPTVNFNW